MSNYITQPVRSREDAEALFSANRGLAFCLANRWRRRASVRRLLSRDELDNLCLMALWRACHRHDPARGKIGSYLDWFVRSEVNAALKAARRPEVPASMFDNGDAGGFLDSIPDPDADGSDFLEVSRLHSAVALLDATDARVITERYGLDGHGKRTGEEIASTLGVSRERIRQREVKALRTLRRLLET